MQYNKLITVLIYFTVIVIILNRKISMDGRVCKYEILRKFQINFCFYLLLKRGVIRVFGKSLAVSMFVHTFQAIINKFLFVIVIVDFKNFVIKQNIQQTQQQTNRHTPGNKF